MEVEVYFFGSITDITMISQLMVNDCIDTQTLINQLNSRFPALANKKYFLALNQKMIHANTQLKTGDTVALMPPFSGG